MKERPILFSAPMVRAILEGRKTQTRRVFKGTTEFGGPYNPAYLEAHRGAAGWQKICPFGVPGDRLWVREAFRLRADQDGKPPTQDWWKAGAWYQADVCEPSGCGGGAGKLRSPIHMPRWASRITLEITEVRVQRVQEISHRDALAEGVDYDVSKTDGAPLPRFQKLWDSINAKRGLGWAANPWVWCLTFKRVAAPQSITPH